MRESEKARLKKINKEKASKGRVSLPKYEERVRALNSQAMSFDELQTIFGPAKASHTPLSGEDSSSKDLGLTGLGFSVQYRGNPSRAVGLRLFAHTLKKRPFQPLKEFWKRVRRILPATPKKLTQRLFPCFFTSKK